MGAEAIHSVDAARSPVWAGLFMGLGGVLVSTALRQSNEHPRSFAALGLLRGSMYLVYAAPGVISFSSLLPLWLFGGAIHTGSITLLGVLMLRKSLLVTDGKTSSAEIMFDKPPNNYVRGFCDSSAQQARSR